MTALRGRDAHEAAQGGGGNNAAVGRRMGVNSEVDGHAGGIIMEDALVFIEHILNAGLLRSVRSRTAS
jgi:hypothetical protein